MDELTDIITDKSTILNFLISNELSDSTEINWNNYKLLIEQREDLICRTQLADMYLGKGEVILCDNKLDDIDIHINEYMIDEIKQEMLDYRTFKKYVLSFVDVKGQVLSLTPSQISQLEYIADNFIGKSSVQARNLLCYYTGNCTDLDVAYSSQNKSSEEDLTNKEEETINTEIKVIPNPNNGQFLVVVPDNCMIKEISVHDVQGKSVDFTIQTNENNKAVIVLKSNTVGIYVLQVNCEDTVYNTRILVK